MLQKATIAHKRPPHLARLYEGYSESRLESGRRLVRILSACQQHGWARASVLDVGCGDGSISQAFAEQRARVTALDRDPGRAENTFRALHRCAGSADCHVLVADAHALPFNDGSFQFVILSDVLEHVENPRLGVCLSIQN